MGFTVKQWRKAKGLSQEYMAGVCGVHRTTYAEWEEKPENISIKNAITICNALGESVNDVFFSSEVLQNVGSKETA